MKITKRRTAGVAMVGALGLAVALVGNRARAQDVAPLVATGQFGVMGAVRGEIVRLNVSNINLHPPDPCRATIEFVDMDGGVLTRPDGTAVSRDVVLAAGQSAFVQFHAASMLGRDNTRVQFRPVLRVAPPDATVPPDPYRPVDACVPSLEVIDGASGQTRLVIPGTLRTYSANHNETLLEDR